MFEPPKLFHKKTDLSPANNDVRILDAIIGSFKYWLSPVIIILGSILLKVFVYMIEISFDLSSKLNFTLENDS